MEIIRILNNNVVQAYNDEGKEVILVGKGIAFNAKNNNINEYKIEKVFELKDVPLNQHVESLLNEIPNEYWQFSYVAMNLIKEKMNLNLSGSFLISLADHVYTAIQRNKEKNNIPDFFAIESKYLYPQEYAVAVEIVQLMNETFNCDMDKSEAGFIVLHIIDAKYSTNESDSNLIAEIVKSVLMIVEADFKDDIKKESINYERFLVHLRYFAQRVMEKNVGQEKRFDAIFEALKKDCKKQAECVLKIKEMIKRKYHYLINDEEQCYLLIHVIKVSQN